MLLFVLKPSLIDKSGIGVFATSNIPAGTYLPLFAPRDCRSISAAQMRKLPGGRWCRLHSVRNGRSYETPANWNRMSVGWYMNHSDAPNAGHVAYRYFALRNIKSGEEITVDYRTFASKREYGVA